VDPERLQDADDDLRLVISDIRAHLAALDQRVDEMERIWERLKPAPVGSAWSR
jgi:hypothetical protein